MNKRDKEHWDAVLEILKEKGFRLVAEGETQGARPSAEAVDRRFDAEYPVGSAGFEVLHCRNIEYRKMWLDNFKAEILAEASPKEPQGPSAEPLIEDAMRFGDDVASALAAVSGAGLMDAEQILRDKLLEWSKLSPQGRQADPDDIAAHDADIADLTHNGGQHSPGHDAWAEQVKARWTRLKQAMGIQGGET